LALLDECCRDLSELAYLIQPPLLEEQGLGPALQAHVNRLNQRLGLHVSFHLPSRLGRLPADVETTSFHIAEEALNNIERHSGSPTADIHLRRKSGELLLEVADHGCGISKELLKKLNRGTALPGIGIAGMQERVRLLGGLMEIHSSSQGTTVRVTLQIKRPAAARGRRP
jgi:signal transduction histidine kinase